MTAPITVVATFDAVPGSPIIPEDGCGIWRTLVGGGPDALR